MTQPLAQEPPAVAPEPAAEQPAAERPGAEQPAAASPGGPGLRRRSLLLLAIYVAVHVGTTLSVAIAKFGLDVSWARAVAPWDGPYYRSIVEHGYPAFVPEAGREDLASGAFFPLYPLLVRGVTAVTGTHTVGTGVVVNLLLGAAAVLLVHLAAREVLPEGTAFRAAVLFAVLPGGAVFTLFLSDPLLVVLCAAGLLFLARRQWLVAGLVAAAATATRPNGVGLVIAAAVAAWLAIRKDGDWRALAAPVLAPLGMIGYWAYLGAHTGVWDAWFVIQDRFWHQRLDFGIEFAYILKNPIELLGDGSYVVVELGFPFLLLVAWCVWRGARIPLVPAAFTATLVTQMVLYSGVGPRPRFLLIAFPLTWLIAQRVRGRWLGALIAVFVVGQLLLAWSFSAQEVIP
jgi:hypothetical protein